MRILYITRKYPPTIGGLENAAYQLFSTLVGSNEVKLIKWGGSNKYLPVILPLHFFRSFIFLLHSKTDIIYIQDCLLAPLGLLLKKIFNKPVVVTAAGLDVTYDNKIYQALFVRFIKKLDFVICISQQTKEEVIKKGVTAEKTMIIPYGIDQVSLMSKTKAYTTLKNSYDLVLNNKFILLSVGRLVERKGVHWFIDKVLPELVSKHPNVYYIVAGGGPYEDHINKVIAKNKLGKSVLVTGRFDEKIKPALYSVADAFVMPNIKVKGDIEGQGLVLLEASMAKLPIVASNIEGISSTISSGENGVLVDTRNVGAYVENIEQFMDSRRAMNFGNNSQKYTLHHYGWSKIGKKYIDVFRMVLGNG